MHFMKFSGLSLALLLLLGCSPAENAGTAGPAAAPALAPVTAAAALDNNQEALAALDVADLQERAAKALREDNMYSPAGRNAVEYYLALRDKAPDQPGIRSTLVDLQPYVLIANEQAIVSGRLDEARRLIALLTRMDRGAPALPRLQQSLAAAEATRAADELRALQDAEILATAKDRTEQPAAQEAARVAAARLLASNRLPADPPAAQAATGDRAATTIDAARPPPAAASAAAQGSAARTPADTRVAAVPALSASTSATPAPLPRMLKDAAPRYPMVALNRRIEGNVQVSFTIGADGSVSGARAVSSQPAKIFDKAALTAVSQWRFEATGKSVTTTRTVNFNLADPG